MMLVGRRNNKCRDITFSCYRQLGDQWSSSPSRDEIRPSEKAIGKKRHAGDPEREAEADGIAQEEVEEEVEIKAVNIVEEVGGD